MALTDAVMPMCHPTRLLILNDLLTGHPRVSAKSITVSHPEFSISHADYHLKELHRLEVLWKHPEPFYLTDTPRPERVYEFGEAVTARRVRDVLDVSQGRKVIAPAGKVPFDFPKGEEELLVLARLLSHPDRVKAILSLRRSRGSLLSPAQVAKMLDRPIASISYAFSRLRDAGVAEIRETRPRRGATEHMHALAGPRAPAVLALLGILAGRLELMEAGETHHEPVVVPTDLKEEAVILAA